MNGLYTSFVLLAACTFYTATIPMGQPDFGVLAYGMLGDPRYTDEELEENFRIDGLAGLYHAIVHGDVARTEKRLPFFQQEQSNSVTIPLPDEAQHFWQKHLWPNVVPF